MTKLAILLNKLRNHPRNLHQTISRNTKTLHRTQTQRPNILIRRGGRKQIRHRSTPQVPQTREPDTERTNKQYEFLGQPASNICGRSKPRPLTPTLPTSPPPTTSDTKSDAARRKKSDLDNPNEAAASSIRAKSVLRTLKFNITLSDTNKEYHKPNKTKPKTQKDVLPALWAKTCGG